MAFLQVRSCCCGCSLETGTKIIACIGIVINIIQILYLISGAEAWAITVDLILSALGLLVSGLLLNGAIKRKSGYVVPWLVFYGIGLVLLVIAILILIVLAIHFHRGLPEMDNIDEKQSALYLVYTFIGFSLYFGILLAFGTYFFAVVLSFYRDLKEEQEIM